MINFFTLDQSLQYYRWFHWSAEPAGRVLRLFTGSCWGRTHHPSVLCCLKCREVVTSCRLCRCICLNKPNHPLQKLHHTGFYSYAVYLPAGILKGYITSDVHINVCTNTRWRLYIMWYHMVSYVQSDGSLLRNRLPAWGLLKCSRDAVASHVHPFLMSSMWRETASVLQAFWSFQDTSVKKHDDTMWTPTIWSICLHKVSVCVCTQHEAYVSFSVRVYL